MKIAVIGKNGQLAQELNKNYPNHDMKLFGRREINLFDEQSLSNKLDDFEPQAVINASAYTAVDKAESEKEQAYLLNVTAVQNLASYCAQRQIHLVHISTDYVFKGDKGSPYLTTDSYSPQSVYGASKAEGESILKKTVQKNYTIFRTSWVYSCFGNNFVKTMLRLMSEKPELGIIDDQIGSPTWARGLASACIYAIENSIDGVHHWSDLGVASWYDFAMAIQEIAIEKGLLCQKIKINPIPTSAYPTTAKRPNYSVLDKTSLFNEFSKLEKAHWRNQLSDMLEQFRRIEN
ncbi:dTDP-4-dehydrorhamnose reductase [Aliikangiella sp. G2MR2-5]|uniref:dTDP-4-dehydrorhamnose reductase n=1 Tax=Aliikangiella sp. G2MR2-5 TaxID=2788943 RepID=UPI0018ABD195|nr:dTDP-4-dehydrorhamnose reductase [Aliikangiella sp. G2MR2-5]